MSILKAIAASPIGKFIGKNSPTISLVVGIGGFVYTACLVYQESDKFKADMKALEASEKETGEKPTVAQKTGVLVKDFAPAIICGASSIGCIALSHSMMMHRLAGVYGLYVESKTFAEKTYEAMVGKVPTTKIDEIKSAAISNTSKELHPTINNNTKYIKGKGGNTLFKDAWTGRFFTSDHNTIDSAVITLNARMLDGRDDWVTCNEYYCEIEIPGVQAGETSGWNVGTHSRDNPIKITKTFVDAEDSEVGERYCLISFWAEPRFEYRGY